MKFHDQMHKETVEISITVGVLKKFQLNFVNF